MSNLTALRLVLSAKYNGPRYKCEACGRLSIHNAPCAFCSGPVRAS